MRDVKTALDWGYWAGLERAHMAAFPLGVDRASDAEPHTLPGVTACGLPLAKVGDAFEGWALSDDPNKCATCLRIEAVERAVKPA